MNTRSIILAIFLFTGIISKSFADTRYYRASFRDDPSTTIVIGWSPDGTSDNAKIYYGKDDYSTAWDMYPSNHGIDRTTNHQGITSHFARLTGLEPNTVYYFVIKDDQGNSQRMSFKTLPDDPNEPITFISGGDTRTGVPVVEYEADQCRPRRKMGNRLAAKIRPDFIAFSGDFILTNGSDSQWADWWADWNLHIGSNATKGRVLPLLPVYGNHEENDDLYKFFDIPNSSNYYALNMGGGLMRFYGLNTDLECGSTQLNWFEDDLQTYSGSGNEPYWKVVQYHIPIAPHGEYSVQNSLIDCWTTNFETYGIRLAMEGHTHVMKITNPVVPGSGAGSDSGFIQDDDNGCVYLGEGSWGAPMRELYTSAGGKAYNWTYAQGRFPGFSIVTVQKPNIEIRTIEFNDPDDVSEVQEEDPSGTLPDGLVYWDMTGGNDYVYTIPNTAFNFSGDATLSQLYTSEGSLSPSFDPSTQAYTVSLPAGSSSVPTTYAIPADPNASVDISPAQNITGSQAERTTNVTVTAENGTTVLEYDVVFSVQTGGDATLSSLTSDMGELVPAFDPAVFNYVVDLPAGTTSTPTIDATTTDPTSSLDITQAESPNGTATAEVTSNDETITNTYEVDFNVADEDDKEITAFDIDGQLNSNINQSNSTIDVEMPNGTDLSNLTPQIVFVGESINPQSGVAQDFTSSVTYTITAFDASTRDYTVNVTEASAPVSDNANLAGLQLNQGTLSPSFSSNTTHYSANIGDEVTSVEITATAEDAGAEVRIFPAQDVNGDISERTAYVLVIASDRTTTKLYSVAFEKSNAVQMTNSVKQSSVYPNPTTGILNVEIKDDFYGDAEIIVHNGFGKKLIDKNISSKTEQIDLSDYAMGTYFIIIRMQNQTDAHRIIKSR